MRECIQIKVKAMSTNTNQRLHFVHSVTFIMYYHCAHPLSSSFQYHNYPSPEIQRPIHCNVLKAYMIYMNASMINCFVLSAILTIDCAPLK